MELFVITATIPTVQYGNIQPEIRVEAETFEQAKEIGLQRIQAIWDAYGERPLTRKGAQVMEGFIELTTFTGEKIKYNSATHEYQDLEGNHLVSGTEYKKSFDKPFDTALLSGKVGDKYGIPAEVIAEMWQANSKISTTFGTSLHLAMEQWFKHRDHACGDKEYNLPKHPFLRQAVKTFPLKDSNVIPEVVLSNIKEKMSGTADGLDVTSMENKICDVIDYKSDADIKKNLPGHFKQLSYYAKILRLAGWSVGKIVVWNYTDKWERYESEILEV